MRPRTLLGISLLALAAALACGAPVTPAVPLPVMELDAGAAIPDAATAAESADAGARAEHTPLACALGMTWDSSSDSKGAPIAPRALTAAESAQIAELDRRRASDPSPDIREESAFARARMLFEARRWSEAGVAFRELAFEPAKHTGPYAAQLYLECLNVLMSHGAPSCRDEMVRDVPRLMALVCGAGNKDPQTCSMIGSIDAELGRSQATHMPHQEAGERYVALFKQHCQAQLRRGSQTADPHCDELLYNAGVSFRAAGDAARAQDALALMKDPKHKMQNSPLTRRLECILAGDAGSCP